MKYEDRNGNLIKPRDRVRMYTYPQGYNPGDPGVPGSEAIIVGGSNSLATGRGHWIHVEYGNLVRTYPSFCLELIEEYDESPGDSSEDEETGSGSVELEGEADGGDGPEDG